MIKVVSIFDKSYFLKCTKTLNIYLYILLLLTHTLVLLLITNYTTNNNQFMCHVDRSTVRK